MEITKLKCYRRQCDNNGKLWMCSGCKVAYYCSIECQKSDWKSHKHECKSEEFKSFQQLQQFLQKEYNIIDKDKYNTFKQIDLILLGAKKYWKETGKNKDIQMVSCIINVEKDEINFCDIFEDKNTTFVEDGNVEKLKDSNKLIVIIRPWNSATFISVPTLKINF